MSYSSERILLSSEREGRISRFRVWIMVGVALAAILFQVYIPLFFQFLGFLELPLLVVVYFALMRRDQVSGLFIGAFVGLAQDSLSRNPLGMFGIVKTLVGYLVSSIGLRLDADNVALRFVLTFFFFLFHQFLYWVLARALLAQQLAFDPQKTLLLGLLNALVGISLYQLLDKLREKS